MPQLPILPATSAIHPSELKPCFDYVILQPLYREKVTPAGIELLSETAHENIGLIVAIGPWCEDPSLAPKDVMVSKLEVGVFVIYIGTHHTIINAHIKDEHLYMMRSSSIGAELQLPVEESGIIQARA